MPPKLTRVLCKLRIPPKFAPKCTTDPFYRLTDMILAHGRKVAHCLIVRRLNSAKCLLQRYTRRDRAGATK